MTKSRSVRYLLRTCALAYVALLLIAPVGLIVWRSLAPGLDTFIASVTTPNALNALRLSVEIIAVVVPLNVIFGVLTAFALARSNFPGKRMLQAVIDLPFAVSPVVAGAALVLLWGSTGAFGFVQNDLGIKIIFGVPGIILASIFATAPFVIREVEPVLHESGTGQEQAAATLGANHRQTFWRITLPSIRWGVLYGVVLTVARTLGEYGAAIMVSPNLPGAPQTMTMVVSNREDHGNQYGAFAMATLLMALAIVVLIAQIILDTRRSKAAT